MNYTRFFEHWNLAENPFRAEEARHDVVFSRVEAITLHPDFEKIVGDLDRPSTSIVFGEKGSGKTAIRLQIERLVTAHNSGRDERRILLVPYDDLNPILDRLHERVGGEEPLESFRKIRLVDHMDAVLSFAVTRFVDDLLREHEGADRNDLPEAAGKRLRQADNSLKGELLLLQAIYDRRPEAASRSSRLRALLRPRIEGSEIAWTLLMWLGWIMPVGVLLVYYYLSDRQGGQAWVWAFVAALAAWAIFPLKRLVWDKWRLTRLAKRILKQVRTLDRSPESLADAMRRVPPSARQAALLPTTKADDTRYAMFARLRRAARAAGVGSMVVVVDRVDEPTLVNGEADRMRAVVWPMLNNKFLQMEGVGFKLLLPIELRHALFRESASFFQEARLDKSNMIERLTWTGSMLYDLCNARLQACTREGAEPPSLRDIFDDDVARQDIVDALDQMRQPRDAFKMLYQCILEHCSNITEEQPAWRVPRLTLETIRKMQSERVQQLSHGVRPA